MAGMSPSTVAIPRSSPQINDPRVYVTTRQAAAVCDVHVSTVKRWCEAGDLACDFTPGGHRRIDLNTLVRFARENDVPTELDAFGDHTRAVWLASRAAAADHDRLDEVARLWRTWIAEDQGHFIAPFIRLLLDRGVPLGRIFDDAVAPVMRGIGEAWQAGRLRIGDEHRASEQVVDALYRLRGMFDAPPSNAPVALVAGAPGNRHAMGPLLVRLVLEWRGWQVRYLGADVPADELAEQQRACGATLVCVSFAPPQVRADAVRLSRGLAPEREDQPAFRLAMGGATLASPVADAPTLSPPFGRIFTSINAFERWLGAEFAPVELASSGADGERR